jgi:hypothetical protein
MITSALDTADDATSIVSPVSNATFCGSPITTNEPPAGTGAFLHIVHVVAPEFKRTVTLIVEPVVLATVIL